MTIKSPYLVKEPDLLFCSESSTFRPITLDYGDADMLPAGTPISADGKVANDLTAVGLLAYDAYKGYKEKEQIILTGHVLLDKAQEHCGLVYTAEAKAAMKSIIFVGDTELPASDCDWNTMKNRPFGEVTTYGDTLTWDGNTEGLEVTTINADMGMTMIKLSDLVPTTDDLANGVSVTVDMGEVMTLEGYEVAGELIYMPTSAAGVVFIATVDNADFDGLTIPTKGIYTISIAGQMEMQSLTINGYNGFPATTVKQLDTEYLPEHLQFGETIELVTCLNVDFKYVQETNKTGYKLEDGKKYYVKYGDKIFELVAKTQIEDIGNVRADTVYIGNTSLVAGSEGENTGEPFYIATYNETLYHKTSDYSITNAEVKEEKNNHNSNQP